MPKITQLDRMSHRMLAAAIVAALKTVEDEFGVKLHTAGGTLGNSTGVIKIGVEIQASATPGVSAREAEFKRYAAHYGLMPEHFGDIVRIQNQRFRIVGLNMNNPKNAISLERIGDNRGFKCPVATVKHQLDFPVKVAA